MNQIEMKKRQMEMVSYILGLLVLLLLGNVLEDNGAAYLAIAVESFLLFWTFTGSCLADTLGRLVRSRSSKGQYKNATKLRRNALVVEGFLGAVGSVALFLLAEPLGEGLFGLSYTVSMIQILAPIVFVRTLSSVLLGYFQGEGTELPTVISYLVRQVCVFGLSLLFVNLFKSYGAKVSDLLRDDNFTAMYSGMGVSLALLVTEVLLFLFLFLVYRGSRRREKRNGNEGMRTTDTFAGQIAVLYSNLFPTILTTFLAMLPMWLGILFYRKSVADISMFNDYGLFVDKCIPVLGFMILPGCMILMETCHKTAGCLRREENRFARGHFQGGLHMSFVYGLFVAVFTAILAPQLAGIICKTNVEMVTQMLRYGAFVVLTVIVAFYFSELLTALGGKFFVLGLLALYNLVYVGCLALFLNGGKAGVMSLVYAAMIAGAVYVIGAAVLVFLQLRVVVDWLQGIAVPAGVACVVGLILLFATKAMTPHLGNLITAIVALIIGNIIYWILLMLMRNFREQELSYTPCGKVIRMIGQMLRVY